MNVPGTIFGEGKGGLKEKKPSPPQDIIVELRCTLEELYNGCKK